MPRQWGVRNGGGVSRSSSPDSGERIGAAAHPDRAPLVARSVQGRRHIWIELPQWRGAHRGGGMSGSSSPTSEERAGVAARPDPALPAAGSVQARSDLAPLAAGSAQGRRRIRI
jgi:hypothetical protein